MKSIKILVVEDQPSVSEYIRNELKNIGYTSVVIVNCSDEVVPAFQTTRPDVVLMDIFLGGKVDGIEISRQIKKIRDVPVIYISAHSDTGTVEKAIGTSPDGYLVKPFDKHDLYTAIETALYKYNIYKELVKKNQQLEAEIEARNQAEAKLKQTECRNAEIMNGISDAVFVLNKQWNYTTANDYAAEIAGLKPGQLKGRNLLDLFPGVEHTVFFEAYNRVMRQKIKETVEDEFPRPDGQKAWFEVKIYPVHEGILCIASDITNRKKANKKLTESEEKYRNFVQHSIDAFVLTDETGTVIEWNRGQEQLSGIGESDAIGRKIWDIDRMFKVPSKKEGIDTDRLKSIMQEYFQTGKGSFLNKERDVTTVNEHGELRYVQQRSFKIATAAGYRLGSVSRDITELSRTMIALQETEERFHLLSDVTFEGIILHNNGVAFDVNQSFLRMSGYSREEIIGKNLAELLVLEEDRPIVIEKIKKEYSQPYVVRGKNKDGVIAMYEIEARNIIYKDEHIRMAAIRDVTKRFEAEQLLKESEERYRRLIENANDLIYTFAPDGKFTYMSPNCTEMMGYKPEDYLGKTIFDFMHPDDIRTTSSLLQSTLSSGHKVGNVEYRARNIKGEYKWFVASGSPLFDSENKLVAFMGIAHDINARKNAESMLIESEERFKSLFENSNDAIFIHNFSGTIIDVNQRACELLNYEKHEFIGRVLSDFTTASISPRDNKQTIEKYMKHGSANFEGEFMNSKGEIRLVEISSRIFDTNKKLIQGVVRDITERKQTENKISSLAAIIENSDNIAVIKDLDLKVMATNRAFAEAAGKSGIEEMIGKTDAEIFGISPDTEPVKSYMADEKKAQTLKQGEKIVKEEPVVYPGGELRSFLTTKFPVFDKSNRLIATANISTDITRQKNALKSLKVLLKYSESLAESSHALLSGEDEAPSKALKHILKASESSRIYIFKNFDDPNDGLCMKQIHEVCIPGVNPEIDNPLLQHVPYSGGFSSWQEVLSKGDIINSKVMDQPPDVREILQQQGIKSILILPVFIKNEWFGFIGFDDVEKEREWQEQDMKLLRTLSDMIAFYFQSKDSEQKLINNNRLLQSLNASKDKMMSIIGHDLKNPIGQIVGFIDLLITNYEKYDDEKIQYFHNIIYSSTQQVSSLLDNLLQWSRSERGKIQFQPRNFNVSLTTDSTVQLLKAVAENKKISLINNLDTEIIVHADVNMVDTIWRNLISNAIKFTGNGGSVILDYEKQDECFRFSVSDNGVGMTQETKESLFDVTKNISTSGTSGETGTGLGLNICKEFIEKHGGSLTIESEPGKGSTFSFMLPAAE